MVMSFSMKTCGDVDIVLAMNIAHTDESKYTLNVKMKNQPFLNWRPAAVLADTT